MHREEHPTIYTIAMDYLPIQASAVPCEWAFSSGANTDTLHCNRISPVLMEALQMLKFGICTESFDFTSHLVISKDDLAVPLSRSHDYLAELSSTGNEPASHEDVMDKIIREIED